jgi:hypothetical protein
MQYERVVYATSDILLLLRMVGTGSTNTLPFCIVHREPRSSSSQQRPSALPHTSQPEKRGLMADLNTSYIKKSKQG